MSDCSYCAAGTSADMIDLTADVSNSVDNSATLLGVQAKMIETLRHFIDNCLIDVPTNAEFGRTRTARRGRLVAESVEGWILSTEVDYSDVPYEYQILLLPTGEVYCGRGLPRLTRDEVTEDHWNIARWLSDAVERYGLLGWSVGIERLRRLGIDFYTAQNPPAEQLSVE